MEVSALTDMGAHMCVVCHAFTRSLGLSLADLVEPELQISVANNMGLSVVGAIMCPFTHEGGVETGQIIFIARGVAELFLSKAACRELGIISESFFDSWVRRQIK